MAGRLAGSLDRWLERWIAVWIAGSLARSLARSLNDWLAGSLAGSLNDWLTGIRWGVQERESPIQYAVSLATTLPELRAGRGPLGALGPARYLDGRRLYLDPTKPSGSGVSGSGIGSGNGNSGIAPYVLASPAALAPLLAGVLERLVPRAALLTLIASEFATATTASLNSPVQRHRMFPVLEKREPWYGTSYGTVPIDALLAKCQDDAQAVRLLPPTVQAPPPNRFVPTKFALKASLITNDDDAELTRPPELILDASGWRGWFKQDRTFGGPRAILFISLSTPLAARDVKSALASQLWRAFFVDRLAVEVRRREKRSAHLFFQNILLIEAEVFFVGISRGRCTTRRSPV